MLRVAKFLDVMKKYKYSNIVAHRMIKLGQPLNTSFFGFIDNKGCPYGLGYFLEDSAFVFISTYKVRKGLDTIAKELTEKEKRLIPKIILDGLVEVASTQKAGSALYWYLNNN